MSSIAEASPRFMRALAESLGVSTGELRKMAEERLKTIVTSTVQAFGGTVDLVWKPGYPAMVNAERERTTLGTVTLLEQIILKRDADTWDPEFHHRPENHSQHQHPTPYKMREAWVTA